MRKRGRREEVRKGVREGGRMEVRNSLKMVFTTLQ